MKAVFTSTALLTTLVVSLPGLAAGPPEQNIRAAFKMILSQADLNKDGKLSTGECKSIWKDKSVAEKNCTFWDADKNGFITEDEYVKQASSFGNRK